MAMARQAELQKAPSAGHPRSGEDESHVIKTTKSRTQVYTLSQVISSPKNCREKAKKSVIVKPIAKNDVRKLQRIDKHAQYSRFSKNSYVVEPSPDPDNLASVLQESLEGARAQILNAGRTAFNEAYTVLMQKFVDQKATDHSFLEVIVQDSRALGASLLHERIQTTVQRESQRASEVIEICKRIDQFKQTIDSERDKLEAYWTQYKKVQNDFAKFSAQVIGGDVPGEKEPSEGYHIDMHLLDAEHATEMALLLEEVTKVSHEAIEKMKASEKVHYTHSTLLYRQGPPALMRLCKQKSMPFDQEKQIIHAIKRLLLPCHKMRKRKIDIIWPVGEQSPLYKQFLSRPTNLKSVDL
ncbi:hypothetical protein EYC80_003048 [Monilinia laxa]|uniref:Uncharacterized protein n=1 Tax=Monilinia laxa TaxID=61186 RepID=A0A5N6KCI1_MONLA|nr:hypothetical protein EYC80_003048 [Monilinia laxa]